MKTVILMFLLMSHLFALSTHQVAVDQHQGQLDAITQHAIRLGNGPDKVYVFLDPLCPKSQAYLSLISQKSALHRKKSFYIFLYKLRQYDSEDLISYIYQSDDPYAELEAVMIHKKEIDLFDFESEEETERKVKAVAKIAKELKVKRRPYLLSFEKGSPYCTVSEGTAPCLEEYDFENE